MKGNRARNAAARSLKTSVSRAAPSPARGGAFHERANNRGAAASTPAERRSQSTRRPPGRCPNQATTGRSGPLTLLRLAAPNILNLLAIAGMITFDGLFVGRIGSDALAGVSLAFPFVMLIQHAAASGMGGGVSSAIARSLGAGKLDVANTLVLHAFVLALGLAAAFTTLLLLGTPYVFRWMGGLGAMLYGDRRDGRDQLGRETV